MSIKDDKLALAREFYEKDGAEMDSIMMLSDEEFAIAYPDDIPQEDPQIVEIQKKIKHLKERLAYFENDLIASKEALARREVPHMFSEWEKDIREDEAQIYSIKKDLRILEKELYEYYHQYVR